VKAVILVGGEGTRLRPLTYTTPKQMLTVAGVTMLERVLTHLAGHGVDCAVLSMGYRPDPFFAAFPDDRCGEVELRYAVEPEPLDTGGAILFAARKGQVDEPFVVVNGDVLTDLDVASLVALHQSRGAEATIHTTPVDDPSRFGVVPTDASGRVQAFIEKPPPGSAPTNLINAGTYVLEPTVLDRIPGDRRVSIEREVFPALVKAETLYAMPADCYWLDTGTPAAYLKANLDFVHGLRGVPPAPGARETAEGVWQLGSPFVRGEVLPDALVGDAAYVGKGSLVKDSVIDAGARVEDATVLGSVVLAGGVIRRGARVEGSIVGPRAVVADRAEVTALSVLGGGYQVEAGDSLVGALVPSA
jgi:mannose-1-phosphate guanylyltransferase